ncbi:uncharacterized protein LOC119568872 [Penaeus monodon]|uniref:uncharacterized protein LOC119568872 n=1 Tax=Penaeus monodon TaxID=6687 RepID=UPI0018A72730|nr:uncharacterized protein LOC119568872 [Penaeus monodon]
MGVQGDLNALKKQRGTAKGKFTRKIFMTNNEKKATDKPKVKVKRFEPPKFEGNLREYPTFKEDYKNLVQSEYGADPYALKMCLGGEALQTIKGSEGNYDEMFKRLDDKFGNPRKIVDLVISDLKSLRKISDGDTKGFVKMVDQVEQCFLQKERKVLEYMNSNVRTSTSDSRATVHHVENVVENNSESELVKLIRKLNEEQQSKNREFESCIFKGCNSKERFDMIKKNGICFRCLNGYHSARGCKVGKLCDVVIEGQGPCNRNHHPLLHQDRIESSSHNANGKIWNVDAVGMNEISSKVKRIDLSRLPELFTRISNLEVDLPYGEIDMLIGTDCCEILPRVVEHNEGIQLLENQFGFSIRGRHDKITNGSNSSNHIFVRTHKLSRLVDLKQINIESTDSLKTKLDKFFAMGEMGTKCKPQCIKCMCRGCPEPNCISLKEERELALIEEGLLYNEEQKCWLVKYPWLRDPMHLKDNIKVANARLKTTENRLKKLGNEYAMKYQREIEDMIDRGVARKLNKEEIQEYKGPVHYIHHHEVLKPESNSTPIRIVFNSSASYMGQKLNDFWAKGPDILNSLLGV